MSRYFCHTCNVRLERINEDFTCPNCSGGFVEELDDSQGPDDDLSLSNAPLNPLELLQYLGMNGGQRRVHSTSPTTPGGASGLSSSSSAGSTPTTVGGATSASATSNSQSQPGRGRQFSFVFDGSPFAGGGNGASAGGAVGSDNPMENMILSFIADLITGLGGGHPFPAFPITGNINIGDYAWGREGLDAIVTQLMNSVEGTGPPPLPEDKLNALQKLQITQEQVDAKLQCSVCWEDFKTEENVIRLDCEHIYHPDCILPWLKLHGTCPVCRKDLTQPDQMGTASCNPDNVNDNVSDTPLQQPPPSQSSSTPSNASRSTRMLQEDMEFD